MQEHFDLEACGIVYKAADGLSIRTILSIEQLKIAQGSRVALQGSSGAGKTTLLKVLSGIIRADTGTVRWGKTIVSDLSESRRDLWRGQHCGFLFQDFGLLEGLTAIENVLLPETFTGKITPSARQRARDLLDRFGHSCQHTCRTPFPRRDAAHGLWPNADGKTQGHFRRRSLRQVSMKPMPVSSCRRLWKAARKRRATLFAHHARQRSCPNLSSSRTHVPGTLEVD